MPVSPVAELSCNVGVVLKAFCLILSMIINKEVCALMCGNEVLHGYIIYFLFNVHCVCWVVKCVCVNSSC